MKQRRRNQRRNRRSTPSQRRAALKRKSKERRAGHASLMFCSLLLLATGGLTLWSAQETNAVARRFLSPGIHSVSALRGAEQGQTVLLRGRIDPQTSGLNCGLAIFDHEHLDPGPVLGGRFGARRGASTWGHRERHHPPFTLVSSRDRVAIINGNYAIERPSSNRQLGPDRYIGFGLEDEVLVIGETKNDAVTAHKVFGGTSEEYRQTLLWNQRVLIPAERVLGCLLTALGVVFLARWATFRIRGQGSGAEGAEQLDHYLYGSPKRPTA